MKKLLLLTIFVSFLSSASFAQTAQTITLKDGTSIKGELINVTNGVYTIQSPTMGQVKVSADQISNINTGNAGNGGSTALINSDGKISKDTMNSIQNTMMQDPEIMALIQKLIQDPSIAEMTKNPTLLMDALSMDPERMQNNPNTQKLLQNPTMQEIIRLMSQKYQPASN